MFINTHLIHLILAFIAMQWVQPSPASTESSITFDNYTYATIKLENGQHWMAENLRSSIYANGDSVFNPTDMTSL